MCKRKLLFIYLQICCFLMMLPSFAMSQSPGLPAGWSDGYVYANGIRIHYYHAIPAPEKPVIVMVHGVTDIGLSWAPVAWELQDSYDIYMLDARGHGLSDPFISSDDGKTLMKDVVAFVEKMGFEEPILIGHSMGAATVMQLGAEHPDLAKAIVMLDPGLGPRGPRPPQNDDDEDTPPPPQRRSNPDPDRISVNMFGSPESLVAQNNYSYQDLVTACRNQTPKWGMAACQYWALSKKQYHGSYSSETWQAISGIMRTGNSLAEIQAPALILKADADAEARRGHEEAVSVMQNGRLVHIDGAGHNLQHDELRRTIEVITAFLSTF